MIDYQDLINGFIGGLFIGLSAVLMMLMQGRVVGISGIAKQLFASYSLETLWRWSFIIGLFLGVLIYSIINQAPPKININPSTTLLIVAGLLVGVGTSLANGCTSGHGVCGIARFSKRSIVATGVFMSSAILTVFLFKVLA